MEAEQNPHSTASFTDEGFPGPGRGASADPVVNRTGVLSPPGPAAAVGVTSESIKITDLTALIWEAISQIDVRSPAPFSFQEIHEAAAAGRLLELLGKNSAGGFTKFLLVRKEQGRTDVERVLDRASKALKGQEAGNAIIGDNPWCLLIAMALQAIHTEFPD